MYKTLLVEDNVRFRHVIRDMILERFPSMQLAETANGGEALRDVNRKCPDLILMNIRLSVKNGLEIIGKVKALCRHIIVILIAAHDSPESREAAFECGADFCLAEGSANTNTILKLIGTIVEKQTSAARPANVVKCWYCEGEFDILSAKWRGCGVRVERPSKACPYCLRCICSHPDYDNEALWGRASRSLKDFGFDRLFYLYL